MQASTNSVLVWKRMADESQQSAKLMARISVCLLVLMTVVGAFAYTSHARYGELCSSIYQQAKGSSSMQVKKAGLEILTSYCE